MDSNDLCEAIEESTNNLSQVSIEDIQARHRKERRELQAKVQGIKKNAPKSDKKKRKDAVEEIAKLEAELEARHALELNNVDKTAIKVINEYCENSVQNSAVIHNQNNVNFKLGSDEDVKSVVQAEKHQRISKAQKRRDKKSRDARQRELDLKAAAEDFILAPKAVESRKILEKLKERGLALYNILSDGDCLYNAIRHQLLEHGLASHTVQSLRIETSNYILSNKESLLPYMTNPDTGELLSDEEFEKYCDDVRTTPAWGGQIELKALSSILKVPIEVIQADGSPTIQGANEFSGDPLVITYHRLLYSLGEHYNSTVAFIGEDNVSEGEEGNNY